MPGLGKVRMKGGCSEGWLNLTVGVRQNLFFRWTGMGAQRGRKSSACGGVGKTGDKVEMKPAVPRFSACGGDGWMEGGAGAVWLFIEKKKPCHGERGAGRWGRVPQMDCL